MIKVNQIEKNYGKFHLNCTMEVPDGCVTGLIGENGAGKSTVFKAIENLIFLDGGSIEVFGFGVFDDAAGHPQAVCG